MSDRKDRHKRKRRYQKPSLGKVKISLEESLLTPCKSDGNYGSPVHQGVCNVCQTLGS